MDLDTLAKIVKNNDIKNEDEDYESRHSPVAIKRTTSSVQRNLDDPEVYNQLHNHLTRVTSISKHQSCVSVRRQPNPALSSLGIRKFTIAQQMTKGIKPLSDATAPVLSKANARVRISGPKRTMTHKSVNGLDSLWAVS